MSYILDALRKSQQARQSGPAPEPHGAVHNISLSLPGAGWWLAAGIVLLFGILAAAFIFWRGTVGGAPSLPDETTPPPASVIEPVPLVKEQTPSSTEKPAKSVPPVHDLAEEARVPVRVTPEKTVLVPDSGKAELKNHSAEPATVTSAPLVPDDAPLLQQMPMDFQHALPPLRVSIHVYAPDPSQRILFINNRQYHEGDRIEGDVRVEEIVPDGVILSYHGERFKLGRPR